MRVPISIVYLELGIRIDAVAHYCLRRCAYILFAAKFEELELHVPLISQLKAAVGGCYTAAAIAQTELQILFR